MRVSFSGSVGAAGGDDAVERDDGDDADRTGAEDEFADEAQVRADGTLDDDDDGDDGDDGGGVDSDDV